MEDDNVQDESESRDVESLNETLRALVKIVRDIDVLMDSKEREIERLEFELGALESLRARRIAEIERVGWGD